MAKKKESKKSSKLVGFSPPPKIIEEKPETVADGPTYAYTNDYEKEKPVVFVPDEIKIERVERQVKKDRIAKDKVAIDFWLRHTMMLSTKQIKKLWKKIDEMYR